MFMFMFMLTFIHDLNELKQGLIHGWCNLDQIIVNTDIDSLHKRLWARVQVKGDHFEYTIWTLILAVYDLFCVTGLLKYSLL